MSGDRRTADGETGERGIDGAGSGALSRRRYLTTVAATAATSVATAAGPAAAEHPDRVPASDKRGFVGADAARGNAVGAAWNYDYMPGADGVDRWHHDSFVPMINGDDLGWTNGAADVVLSQDYDADAVLGYNEPEHEEGYTDVNTILYPHWQDFTSKFRDTDVTIVSPSIKTATSTGRAYLDDFVSAVESDDSLVVDELAVHWYPSSAGMRDDPVGQAQRFLDRMEWLYERYGRPLWITEFGGPNFANIDAQALASANVTFLENTIAELEARDYVKRYAWWTGGPATRLTEEVDGELRLTDVGEAYVGIVDGGGSHTDSGPTIRAGDLPSARTASDDRYRIVNAKSGSVLEVADAATGDGADVQQGADEGASHQRWDLRYDADGTYELVAVHSGKVLDVENGSEDNGANVHQYAANGGTNQRWYVDPVGDDAYRLVPDHSELVLEIFEGSTEAGATAGQWEWNGGDHQRWRLEPAEVTDGEDEGEGETETATETEPPAVDPIDGTYPTDPDGDGLFEDLDGNGDATIGDAVRLFRNRNADALTSNADAYDFNDSGAVDIGDAVALFREL